MVDRFFWVNLIQHFFDRTLNIQLVESVTNMECRMNYNQNNYLRTSIIELINMISEKNLQITCSLNQETHKGHQDEP